MNKRRGGGGEEGEGRETVPFPLFIVTLDTHARQQHDQERKPTRRHTIKTQQRKRNQQPPDITTQQAPPPQQVRVSVDKKKKWTN
jgi:hypothetical protein